GQTHHSRLTLLANANRRCRCRALVSKPKGLPGCRFTLELGKPRRLSLPLSFATGGEPFQRSPQIDCGLFEHLLAHLRPPDQPGPGFIARGDAPKLLQTAEPALDDVAQPINLLVNTPRHDAIRASWDHDFEIELP